MQKLRVAVHKFTSCDGCQLQFLNMEDALLTLAERVEIVSFNEATSRIDEGPYDVSFLEGSVSCQENVDRLKEIRAHSGVLVAIGACATAGGIQALRNWGDHGTFMRSAYADPQYVDSLAQSTAFSEHVPVDVELFGCPPDQAQIKSVVTDALSGVSSYLPGESVCMQCKRRGNVCVLVAQGQACMGPVTRTGCGALCPRQERDCYACFGPQAGGNADALGRRFLGLGLSGDAIARRFRFIYNWDPVFRGASERWERDAQSFTPLPGRGRQGEGQ